MAKYLTLTTPSGVTVYLMDSSVIRAVANSSNVDVFTKEKNYTFTLASFTAAIVDSEIASIPFSDSVTNYLNANRVVNVNSDNESSTPTIVFENEYGQLESITTTLTISAVNDIIGLAANLTAGSLQVTAVGTDATTAIHFADVMPIDFNFVNFYGMLDVPAEGASLFTVDILKNGTSILDDLITFDSLDATTEAATTPFTFDTNGAFDKWDKFSIEVTQVGNTTAGQGLSIAWIGYPRG